MEYIFVAGLEHSGTTLTDQLLSQSASSIGLGEISQFFSENHMRNYMLRWGSQDDVDLCSCKAKWSECDFWADVEHLNGLNSNNPSSDKYLSLFNYIQKKYGLNSRVIDSSKSIESFHDIEKCIAESDLITKVHIVFTCKDVRSFAASIVRKTKRGSLLDIYRTYNWWVGFNQRWLRFLEQNNYQYTVNVYEYLCRSPQSLVAHVMGEHTHGERNGISHIAMGNKNFALRNNQHISYDDAWRKNWKIRLVYFLHIKARKLNSRLYKLGFKG